MIESGQKPFFLCRMNFNKSVLQWWQANKKLDPKTPQAGNHCLQTLGRHSDFAYFSLNVSFSCSLHMFITCRSLYTFMGSSISPFMLMNLMRCCSASNSIGGMTASCRICFSVFYRAHRQTENKLVKIPGRGDGYIRADQDNRERLDWFAAVENAFTFKFILELNGSRPGVKAWGTSSAASVRGQRPAF